MEHPAEHLEHFEHQQHAAHDPFDKRVAMTMAIVAASLACMTMLGHRAHNGTLRFRIEAGDKRTQAANLWAYYQAKNIRKHDYQRDVVFLAILPKLGDEKAVAAANQAAKDWQKQLDDYKVELPEHKAKAEKLEEEANDLEEQSKHLHHLADGLDVSELGVEFSLVLCSLAVLTKRRPFWYVGILSGALGAGFGLYSYGMHLLH